MNIRVLYYSYRWEETCLISQKDRLAEIPLNLDDIVREY